LKLPTKNFFQLTKPHPFVRKFRGFKNDLNRSTQTPDCFFSLSKPEYFPKAEQICSSQSLLDELKLDGLCQKDLSFLSGDPLYLKDSYVTRYGGHQFGNWAGQLGDGRAHTLGQFDTKWDVQVKGSGANPYSRSGDGYAVLRSSLREFLMSEYMHHAGVPTTRALNLMTTGTQVLRDMFYNGNAAYESGALVTRLAPSFIRFGHFQIFSQGNELQNLKELVHWTIDQHFPNHTHETTENLFEWFNHICEETLKLAVHWMRLGFVHGVLNTDNMSILGLTIDYGPFSMLDEYDRNFTPNTTDLPGRRYSFENQPAVCLWNLERLAEALYPLTEDTSGFSDALKSFKNNFRFKFERMYRDKLGLPSSLANSDFIMKTEQTLQDYKLDYSLFFSSLDEKITNEDILNLSYKELNTEDEKALFSYFDEFKSLSKKLNPDQKKELEKVKLHSNPKFNLRNYIFVEVLEDLQKGSKTKLNAVLKALETPYSFVKESPELYQKRPEWAKDKDGCRLLSCSS